MKKELSNKNEKKSSQKIAAKGEILNNTENFKIFSDGKLVRDHWDQELYKKHDKNYLKVSKRISNIFKMISDTTSSHIDGKMLSMMAKLVFYLAFKKSEVSDLRIKDVIDQNGHVYEIIPKFPDVKIFPEVRKFIIQHMKHLCKIKTYQTNRNSFLFQNNKGKQYKEAGRQLSQNFDIPIIFEELRQTGLIAYFESLSNLRSEKQRYEMTAIFARIENAKHAEAIITDKKIQAGKKTPLTVKLNVVCSYIHKINLIIDEMSYSPQDEIFERVKDLKGDIKADTKMDPAIKREFLGKIRSMIAFYNNSNQNNSVCDNLQYTEIVSKVKIDKKREKHENFHKLLWLIENMFIVSGSNNKDDIKKYKVLFSKTLSASSFSKDIEENKKIKYLLWKDFKDKINKLAVGKTQLRKKDPNQLAAIIKKEI